VEKRKEFEMAQMVKGTNANVKKFGVSWKIVRRGIGWVFKNVLLLGMIAILTPGIYFYWRANEPMELPEFGGKTFYQVLGERQQTYAEHEEQWRQTRNGEYPLGSKNMCFLLETFVVFYEKPLMDYALVMHMHSPGDPYYALPEKVHYNGVADFLPTSWTMFEMSTLSLYKYSPHGPSAARGPNHGACVILPPNGMSGGK
jgi:hypothetical protein